MRRILLLLILWCSLCQLQAFAQSTRPEPAKNIMNAAFENASTTHRNVFLIFHASWCIWCKRLDTVLNNPDVSPLIEKNYVVTRIDVLERGGLKDSLENPGAEELLQKLGGKEAGLPFYSFLDREGKRIADSNVMHGKTRNIGFPGSKDERKAFKKLLEQTAPNLSSQERNEIMKHFGE